MKIMKLNLIGFDIIIYYFMFLLKDTQILLFYYSKYLLYKQTQNIQDRSNCQNSRFNEPGAIFISRSARYSAF